MFKQFKEENSALRLELASSKEENLRLREAAIIDKNNKKPMS